MIQSQAGKGGDVVAGEALVGGAEGGGKALAAQTVLGDQRQIQSIAMKLLEHAVERRREILQKHVEATDGARKEHGQHVAQAQQMLEESLVEATKKFEDQITTLVRGLEKSKAELGERHQRDLSMAVERAQRDEQESKSKLEEQLWFVQTSHETDRVKLGKQATADKGVIAGRVAELQRIKAGLIAKVPLAAGDAAQDSEIGQGQSIEQICGDALAQAARGVEGLDDVGGVLGKLVPFAVKGKIATAAEPVRVLVAKAEGLIARLSTHFSELAAQRKAEVRTRFETDTAKAKAKHHDKMSKIQAKLADIKARLAEVHEAGLFGAKQTHDEAAQHAQKQRDGLIEQAKQTHAEALERATRQLERAIDAAQCAHDQGWSELVARWDADCGELAELVERTREVVKPSTRAWTKMKDDGGAGEHGTVVAAAMAELDLGEQLSKLEGDARLRWPFGSGKIQLPIVLEPEHGASMLVHVPSSGVSGTVRNEGVDLLSMVCMRLLTTLPPGAVRFTFLDPVALGESFASFMQLADYPTTGGSLVGQRVLCEARDIEQALTDVTNHMATVIQKYLRGQYQTIAQYNQAAAEVAEPYRFVVMADFPHNLTETSASKLESIVTTGARCGVYAIILAGRKEKLPTGIKWETLRRHAIVLSRQGEQGGEKGAARWVWDEPERSHLATSVEPRPSASVVSEVLARVGSQAVAATRVQVPFSAIAPEAQKRWTLSASKELVVPLGRAGARSLQSLRLGTGTAQHVLIAGRTGSGKSTLLHVLISNAALWHSPNELELYLIDFKKGVEFKAYANLKLPHARVIAIESEREFGLSVLRRLDEELTRRGDLFRDAGVQDLASFRASRPGVVLPRTLLVVDEFQEFFVVDDKLAQEAGLLLDRIVRQGRAFGVHAILGSQTLAGAYSLARATLGQMAVRIALQCSEADSYVILADDNPAARLLARPGQAIYNDASGLVEGNSLFQVCWVSDEERASRLSTLPEEVRRAGMKTSEALVFEGQAPADLTNEPMLDVLRGKENARGSITLLFGAPISIKQATHAVLSQQSAENVLIVGQNEGMATGILVGILVGLRMQRVEGQGVKVILIDGTASDSPYAGVLGAAAGQEAQVVAYRQTEAAIAQTYELMKSRLSQEPTAHAPVVLMIAGLQRFRTLRAAEDDFSFEASPTLSVDKQLAELLKEGSTVGVHVVVSVDSALNAERAIKRQTLARFDTRVLMQMSATDSSNLIENPTASSLGNHRALMYSEQNGTIERFRPFAVPGAQWIESLGGKGGAER